MKTIKKTLALLIALILAITAAAMGCSKSGQTADVSNSAEPQNTQQTGDSTPEPTTQGPEGTATPEPEATGEPATEIPPTEVPPTEAPANYPTEHFYAPLDEDVPLKCDLDFDGLEDTVLLSVTEGEYDNEYSLVFTLGCNPNYTISLDYDYPSYYAIGFVTDCDLTDSRLDVIVTFSFESDDNSTCHYRVDASGESVDFNEYGGYVQCLNEEDRIYADEGRFYFCERTDVLGTSTVGAFFTADKDGWHPIDGKDLEYNYIPPVKCIRDLEVKLVDKDGNETGETVIRAGETVSPISTDNATYVIVLLPGSSELAKIEFKLEGWLPYINGEPQHNYFDCMYAD